MSDKMPVGEWIEINMHQDVWATYKPKYVGKTCVLCETFEGCETVIGAGRGWRYPINQDQAIRDKIISEWHGINADNTYAYNHKLVVIETFVQWLIDRGYIEVEE